MSRRNNQGFTRFVNGNRRAPLRMGQVPIIGGTPEPKVIDRLGREVKAGDLVLLPDLPRDNVPTFKVTSITPQPHPQAPGGVILQVIVQTTAVLGVVGADPNAGIVLVQAIEEQESPAEETPQTTGEASADAPTSTPGPVVIGPHDPPTTSGPVTEN